MSPSTWKPDEGDCESNTPFVLLPDAVREQVEAARGWDMEDMQWQAIQFVDRPNGRHFQVRRTVDEIGMQDITVYEIRYTERLNPGW